MALYHYRLYRIYSDINRELIKTIEELSRSSSSPYHL